MSRRDGLPILAAFAAVYLVWGSTFLAIRYAVETIPPFTMMALRCLLGGSILLAVSRVREPGAAWPSARQWAGATVLGMLFFVSCHGLLAREEQYVPSGIAALCLATIPLFVPLLAWALTGPGRPTARTAGALVAGFAGVAMLVAAQGSGGGLSVTDAALLLLTSLSWAAGTVATRLLPVPDAPMTSAAASLLAGAAVLAVIAAASGDAARLHPADVTLRSAAGLAYLVILGTVVTFSAFVWVLRHVPPARVATYAFVNPVVAVLLGWAVGDQSMNAGTALATSVIVAAVAVAVTDRAPQPAPRRPMAATSEPV